MNTWGSSDIANYKSHLGFYENLSPVPTYGETT